MTKKQMAERLEVNVNSMGIGERSTKFFRNLEEFNEAQGRK